VSIVTVARVVRPEVFRRLGVATSGAEPVARARPRTERYQWWDLLAAAAGVFLLLGAAGGGLFLIRRRKPIGRYDPIEAELQEIIAEERARELLQERAP
jgi:hypothetical protein